MKTILFWILEWATNKIVALISLAIRIWERDKKIDASKDKHIEQQKEAATDDEFDKDSDDSFNK